MIITSSVIIISVQSMYYYTAYFTLVSIPSQHQFLIVSGKYIMFIQVKFCQDMIFSVLKTRQIIVERIYFSSLSSGFLTNLFIEKYLNWLQGINISGENFSKSVCVTFLLLLCDLHNLSLWSAIEEEFFLTHTDIHMYNVVTSSKDLRCAISLQAIGDHSSPQSCVLCSF